MKPGYLKQIWDALPSFRFLTIRSLLLPAAAPVSVSPVPAIKTRKMNMHPAENNAYRQNASAPKP